MSVQSTVIRVQCSLCGGRVVIASDTQGQHVVQVHVCCRYEAKGLLPTGSVLRALLLANEAFHWNCAKPFSHTVASNLDIFFHFDQFSCYSKPILT